MPDLLSWLSEAIGGGAPVSGGNPMQPGPPPMVMNPMTGQEEQRRHVPSQPTGPMPPPQGLDPSSYPRGSDPMTAGGPPPFPGGGDPMMADRWHGQYPPGGDPMTAGNTAAPSSPYPPGSDPMTAGGTPGAGPGLPPPPLPQPRPEGANAPRSLAPIGGSPPIPPPGNGTNGVGPGLGVGVGAQEALESYRRAGGTGGTPGAGPEARTILGRALGLNPNQEAGLRGSLASGLKAAGENSGKRPLAAFAGTAGSAFEGGKNADDKTIDQQGKVLDRATRAKEADQRGKSAGITDQLNAARTQLATEQAKMAKAGGKDSVMNSPQQLYLRGMGLVNNDPEVKLAKSTYDNALKLGDPASKEVQAAKKAHADLVAAKTKAHLESLGVDPKMADKIGKQPGMSQENPMPSKGLTQDKLNALPPGTWVMGPDGKALQKKAPPAGAAGPNQPAPAQSMTPQVQPPIPPVARNAMATMGADDEED